LATPSEKAVRCDGSDAAELKLHVADLHGNGLSRAQVALTAASGTFDPVASLGDGDFVARYHPPIECASGPMTVNAAAGDARGEVTVSLSPRPARGGVTLKLTGQSNFGRVFAPAVEAEGELRLSNVSERLQASAA